MAAKLPLPRYCLYNLPPISIICPGASGQPANKPPQMTACATVSALTKSGDIVKALTVAHAVICGGLFAGCPEAPGQMMEIGGKLYKQYRGKGSFAAMKVGSAARYGHSSNGAQKVAPEGVEALK